MTLAWFWLPSANRSSSRYIVAVKELSAIQCVMLISRQKWTVCQLPKKVHHHMHAVPLMLSRPFFVTLVCWLLLKLG